MNTRMFWNRVKACIKNKRLTQQEVAKGCRFPFSTFRNWMSKNINPPIMYANRISKYLGVSLEYLISGKERDIITKTNEEIFVLIKKIENQLMNIKK